MSTLYDENGQPKEAYTQEEMDELKTSADETKANEMKAIQDDADAKIVDLQERLDDLNTKLAGKDDKDKNFEALRKSKQTAEEKLEEFQEETTKKIIELESKVLSGVEKVKVETLIEKMVGDDPELIKKVKFYYEVFKGVPEDDEKVKERVESSILLAKGHSTGGSLPSNFASSGGGNPPKPVMPDIGKLENPESKGVAKNLGVSEEELKKNNLI